ncbi:hypothetical protein Droror1_Dr00003302 [Drosera rotundifolia]
MISGRSMGRAEVVCSRQTDAEAAMKKYNNFKFRGRYMKVKIVGRFYNRRFSNHATYRPVPYAPPKIQAPDAVRGHGLIADQAAPSTTSSAIETEAKLFISHLDHEISYKDIEKHFSKTGQLLRYSLHYERTGQSRVTAEVVYSRREDARKAMAWCNNVSIGGKSMKIEIVDANATSPVDLPRPVADLFSECGYMKECLLNYDKHGRARGIAEVVYRRRCDALKAVDTFNNQLLVGRRIRIKIVGVNDRSNARVGELKECLLNYDKHGRPRGTAEVVYSRRCDALKAVGSYNNYPLRGWPVKIDIVDANVKALVDLLGPVAGSTGNTDWASNFGRGRGGVVRQGGWRHGFGRERGRSKKRYRSEEVSAEELDADLDRYTSKAMPRLK